MKTYGFIGKKYRRKLKITKMVGEGREDGLGKQTQRKATFSTRGLEKQVAIEIYLYCWPRKLKVLFLNRRIAPRWMASNKVPSPEVILKSEMVSLAL